MEIRNQKVFKKCPPKNLSCSRKSAQQTDSVRHPFFQSTFFSSKFFLFVMQKISLLALFVLAFAALLTQFSCKKEESCTTENMSFKNHIQPILSKNKCTDSGCHGATTGIGAVSFTTYNGFVSMISANRLIGAIKWQSGFSQMPKNSSSKISDCDISQIEAWIAQGLKDN